MKPCMAVSLKKNMMLLKRQHLSVKTVRCFFLPHVGFLLSPVKGQTWSTLTLMLRPTPSKLNSSFPISTLLRKVKQSYHNSAFLSVSWNISQSSGPSQRSRHQNVTNHLLVRSRNVWPARLYLKCDFLSELNIRKTWLALL